MQLTRAICQWCAHRQSSNPAGHITCDAYPNGVPENIRLGKDDHSMYVAGDQGILFELNPMLEEPYLIYLADKGWPDARTAQ